MCWAVLHVRPRCEKKMADYCRFYGVENYLPLRSETKIYQRRKVVVEKPVFPGYVFAALREKQRALVTRSNSIARIIDVGDQDRFVREVEQVRKALTVDPTLGATAAFTQGRMARITAGPFQGLEGVIAIAKGAARLVLNVQMIGKAVSVEVDMDMLEPAE